MNKLRTVILDDVDVAIFLDCLGHREESAVRLRAAIGPCRVTERITRANNVAGHLDFGELSSVAVRKAKYKGFAGGLGGTVKIHRQVARDFAHRGAHAAHCSRATRVNKLLATSLCCILKQHHGRPGVVH